MPRVSAVSSHPMVSSYVVKRKKKPAKKPGVGSVRGHGAYSYDKPGPWGRYGRAIGAEVADAIVGKYLGSGLARGLGSKAGGLAHYVGRIFGSGDYVTSSNQVKSNVLVNESQIPQFGSSVNTVHIRHREYLGDIVSSSSANTFQIQSFSINPGLMSFLPWLSQVCGSTFQQYRINGMIFEYRTMSADALNSTNTALGSVVMATDYDSADAAFTTKAQMENTEFGVSCKPSQCMVHAIECARSQTAVNELYIRNSAVASGNDIRLYDWGKFYIATTGFQGTSVNCGELWCSYDITFFKAIQQVPGALIPSAHYQLNTANVGTQPFSILTTGNNYDNIGLTVTGSGLVLNWPYNIPVNSIWMISLTYITNNAGAAAATILSTASLNNGMQGVNVFNSDGTSGISTPNPSPGGATNRAVTSIVTLKYVGGGNANALPNWTLNVPTTPLVSYTGADMVVTMLNGSLV